MSHKIQYRALTNRQLSKELKDIYTGVRSNLSGREFFVTVYRPYYSPLREIFTYVEQGATLLEIGCGAGPILYTIDRHCEISRGLGIDLDSRAIDIARRVNTGNRLFFEEDVLYDLPRHRVERYNCILCFDVLHHIPKQEKFYFLDYLTTVVREGTVILLKDLDTTPWYKARANDITDWLSSRSLVSYMSMENMIEYFKKRGFDIIQSARLDMWVWSHFLVVARKSNDDYSRK